MVLIQFLEQRQDLVVHLGPEGREHREEELLLAFEEQVKGSLGNRDPAYQLIDAHALNPSVKQGFLSFLYQHQSDVFPFFLGVGFRHKYLLLTKYVYIVNKTPIFALFQGKKRVIS